MLAMGCIATGMRNEVSEEQSLYEVRRSSLTSFRIPAAMHFNQYT